MLPIASWSYFSFLYTSYSSVWILVDYGHPKKGSCLVPYTQTRVRIPKNLLSKELRHNRFTKEISKENGCEVLPAELSSSQLREVTERWELKVQELEPEDLTFKSDSAILTYIKMRGELRQPYLRKVPSLWWGQGGCTVSSRQYGLELSVGSWIHIVLFLLPVAKQDGNENEIFTPSTSMTQLACSRHQSGCLPLPVTEQ